MPSCWSRTRSILFFILLSKNGLLTPFTSVDGFLQPHLNSNALFGTAMIPADRQHRQQQGASAEDGDDNSASEGIPEVFSKTSCDKFPDSASLPGQAANLPREDFNQTKAITAEFFELVQRRLAKQEKADEMKNNGTEETSGTGSKGGKRAGKRPYRVSNKDIWEVLSSRAGFDSVTTMLKEALKDRKDASKLVNAAVEELMAIARAEKEDAAAAAATPNDDNGGSASLGSDRGDGDSVRAPAVGSERARRSGQGGRGRTVTLVPGVEELVGPPPSGVLVSTLVGRGGRPEASNQGGGESLAELERQEMTPSDVIDAALSALRVNDDPSPNHGIGVLLSLMSDASSFGEVKDASVFATYIKNPESAYNILLNWQERVYVGKLELSLDGRKAYQIVKLRATERRSSEEAEEAEEEEGAGGSASSRGRRKAEWYKVKWALSKQRCPVSAPTSSPSARWPVSSPRAPPVKQRTMWSIDNVLVLTSRR